MLCNTYLDPMQQQKEHVCLYKEVPLCKSASTQVEPMPYLRRSKDEHPFLSGNPMSHCTFDISSVVSFYNRKNPASRSHSSGKQGGITMICREYVVLDPPPPIPVAQVSKHNQPPQQQHSDTIFKGSTAKYSIQTEDLILFLHQTLA